MKIIKMGKKPVPKREKEYTHECALCGTIFSFTKLEWRIFTENVGLFHVSVVCPLCSTECIVAKSDNDKELEITQVAARQIIGIEE